MKLDLAQYRVTKSNALINASYKLTLNEQRLVLSCIAQIDSRRSSVVAHGTDGQSGQVMLDQLWKIKVTAADFAKTFDLNPRVAYDELKTATKDLYERTIRTTSVRKNRQGVATRTVTEKRWIISRSYEDGSGFAEITFNPEIAGYLTMLRDQFTTYTLHQVASFRSIYTIRLFELLIQYRKTGYLLKNLDDLIDLFQLSYTRYADVRRSVIEPAIKELAAKSNLIVAWKPIKTGRPVTHIEFTFTENPQTRLAFGDTDDAPPAVVKKPARRKAAGS
jgi:plasmid replication initiation protein